MARTQEIVKVDKETFSYWQMKRAHGDIAYFHNEFNLPRKEISDALNLGFCTESLKKSISKHYQYWK